MTTTTFREFQRSRNSPTRKTHGEDLAYLEKKIITVYYQFLPKWHIPWARNSEGRRCQQVKLSRGIASHRSIFEHCPKGIESSCYPRYSAYLVTSEHVLWLINVNGPGQSGRRHTREAEMGTNRMTFGLLEIKNSRRFNGSGSSGIHQKSSAEYTRTSIFPPGPLTCRESNGRRFDKSAGSAGVNVAQFSYLFWPSFPFHFRKGQGRLRWSWAIGAVPKSIVPKSHHRGRVCESKNRGNMSRGGTSVVVDANTLHTSSPAIAFAFVRTLIL